MLGRLRSNKIRKKPSLNLRETPVFEIIFVFVYRQLYCPSDVGTSRFNIYCTVTALVGISPNKITTIAPLCTLKFALFLNQCIHRVTKTSDSAYACYNHVPNCQMHYGLDGKYT